MFASINMFAQGTVNFANNSATAVTNSVTGLRVIAGTTAPMNQFVAGLFYAPDTGGGAPAESAMAQIATTTISPVAGLIQGGKVTTPLTTAPGAKAYFQIRVWETAFGSWDNAQTAVVGGKNAIAGASAILLVTTGDPNLVPPGTPGNLITAGLKTFTANQIVPEPSVIGLGLLGAGALMFLRRRK